ncbi:MAG TPA: vWA domain-containing protein [Polyangiaceae bacterium]|nr:vWA domain-containing protein [Polyangiaceae bacterium]
MRKHSTLALFATLLLSVGFGCSDEEGSAVSDLPDTGGSSSGGSSTSGSAGKGSSTAGTANLGGDSGTIPEIPTDACKGLPIDISNDPQGGAPATGVGGTGDAAGGAAAGGAPAEPAVGGAPAEPAAAGAAGDSGEACIGVSVEAEVIPVDLFMMMDRSQSMGFAVEGSNMTRWEALRDAVQSFVEDPAAGDIGAGIGFFSISGGAIDDLDCSVDDYAEPVVPIGLLADVGADLVAAIEEVTPAGLTPTVPALQGAITYAQSWAQDNSDRATVVVLVSDGFPTQCSPAPEDIAAAAKAGYESPEHIRTFVIGVGQSSRFNLDNYARAGGTTKAFLTESDDVSASFVDALSNITNSELACEYRLPEPPNGMRIDVDRVQVVYTPASGGSEEVPSIANLAACAKNANGGWYYDDPNNPTKISVCPCTCARFQAGRVDVRLGCKPRIGLR